MTEVENAGIALMAEPPEGDENEQAGLISAGRGVPIRAVAATHATDRLSTASRLVVPHQEEPGHSA